MLGGYTEMEREARRPGAELLVALVGPAVSFVLGVLGVGAVVLLPPNTVPHELAFQFAVSNLLVAVFNTLPGLPLDGGRALRALVWAGTKDPHLGTRAAGWVGRAVAAAVLVGAVVGYLTETLTPIGVFFLGAVGVVLWLGAGRAIREGTWAARVPSVRAGELARPALAVPGDTSVAAALQRAGETGAVAIVVVDAAGTPTGVVSEPAVAAVPPERTPWVTVAEVARSVTPEQVVAAELTGHDVIGVIRADPAAEYPVVAAGRVVGVLRTAELVELLDKGRKSG